MDVDFQVEIGLPGKDGYPVVFRAAGGEEAPGVLRLPPIQDVEALAARVPDAVLASSARVRRAVVGDEAPVRELGQILFDALLAGTGSALLMAARNRVAHQGGQVRLVLRVQPPELARLPWEFMYDTAEDCYLGLDLPLVRHLQVARPVAALRVAPPLRILGMVARPDDQEPLAAHTEQQRLREALADLVAEGRVELGWVAGQTWRDLRDAVRRDARTSALGSGRGGWHVLHFIGHGGFDARAKEGTLALAGERGGTHLLGAGELAMLLAGHPSLRLAVLNACESGRADGLNPFSSVAGALMRKGMPAVLAMQYEVSDDAAVECARTFYEALARQLPIDVAVMEARQTMSIYPPHTLEWGTPVLYMRSLDGNGHLFDLDETPGPLSHPQLDSPQPVAPGPEKKPPVQERADLDDVYAEGLGALYTDRWDQAVEAFRTIVAHDRDYRDSEAKLTQARHGQRLAALYTAATDAATARDWGQAIEHLQTIVSAEPGHRDAQHLLDQARHEQVSARLRDEITTLHRTSQWQAVLAAAERLRRHTQDADPGLDPELEAMVSAAREAMEAAARDRTLARHYREALDHIDAGRWHRGLGSLAKIRAIRPDYRDTDQIFGRVQQEIGGTAPAIADPAVLITITAPRGVNAVAFSPDGTRLGLACNMKTALVTDDRGKELIGIRHGGLIAAVWSVTFASDGRRIATASGDYSARVWDADTGSELLKLTHEATVRAVAFSPDGRRIATASEDHSARVWDVDTGSELLKVTHTGIVAGVAFSPDGRRIATAGWDNTARVWDVDTGSELLKVTHTKSVRGVAFSPDGRRIATAGWDNTARVWDADTGSELLKVTHAATVGGVAFSPDGRRIATAGWDSTARVWDADTGSELLEITHTKAVNGVAFSADGRRIATASDDKTVQIWRLSGEDDD
ncbi:CHAT domain-containing protein [Streptomyces sp. NBC_00243]|uniref:CHAT domain-containing WD40 repeat protein n=1 Tax=Streptomyces sp. NBC_00243 TaxID=2975688 RepID=UPI002DD9C2F2|nr:CHAT domain-containing protein [Streptomyces sp. NBC_00243]WRZ20534.1 CHAT domain-containing protein [Streptomyces sp. NBC_00243]